MTMKHFTRLSISTFLFLILLIACQPQTVEVEVTRTVSETAVEEVESVSEEPAEEAGRIEAIGSEEDGGGSPFEPGSGPKVAATRVAGSGWVDESGTAAAGEDGDVARAADAPEGAALAAEPAAAIEEAVAVEVVESEGEAVELAPPPEDDAAAAEIETRSGPAEDAPLALDQNSRLTAGDVDDNAKWDDYLLYRRQYSGARVLDVDVSERHHIFVKDSAGRPVLGAVVRIEAGGREVVALRTHSDGRAYFFPQALPADQQTGRYSVRVLVGESEETFTLASGGSQTIWEVTHPGADQRVPDVRLDVLFLIDATGSMADEIQQLKENIRAISARIDALPTEPDVRFAMTIYRDRDDAFTSRTFEFTPDVEFFAEGLAEVEAAGGGDYPEDLNEGLFKAIHVPEWRVENTVSLIFLVADAPPHLDYADQETDYAVEMQAAAERGIKIYPIGSSGLDAQGEYIFRQLAQFTGGRFLFLTYGAGGAGTTGTETSHTVEGYDVTSLDGLVIKIVEEELAHLER